MKFNAITIAVMSLFTIVSASSDAAAQVAIPVPASASTYAIIDHFKIGGEGLWDYLSLDSRRHHLFVTRGAVVQVVDTKSGKLVGTLTDLEGSHGVAIADDLKLGFISNGKGNSMTTFDLETLKPIGTVKVTGTNPDAILYEPTTKQVYSINHESGNITVVDAVTRKIVSTIKVLDGLEFAVTNGKGKIFVNSEDANEVAVIDVATAKMETHWKLGTCKSPTGLAIDTAHERLFAVCGNNKMIVIDSKTGKIVTELPIGNRPDSAAFDAKLGMVYSSNGDGTLTVIHEDDADHFHVVENLPTAAGARTMVLDPESHRLYLSMASYGPAPVAMPGTAKPRASMLPDSFTVLVVAPKTAQ